MANDTRICFFPSGTVAPGNVACSSDQYTSCCGTNDLCLSNGLCLSVSHQPFVLSRGACTDPEWGSGCPQYCRNNNPEGGCTVSNLNFELDVSTYCCGNLEANDSTVICPNNAGSFEIPTGHPMVGYAMLANISTLDAATTNSSSNDTCTDTPLADSASCTNGSCHSTAIGAGVGVPLGVIALASIAWAFFERRRANALSSAAASPGGAGVVPVQTYKQVQGHRHFGKATASELEATIPSELDARG
ncbi:hypothetical protein BJX76DRAFT_355147 [Aspergillus varians]